MISALCVIPACPESIFVFGMIPDLPAGRQARLACGNDSLEPRTDFEIGSIHYSLLTIYYLLLTIYYFS